MKQQKFSRLLPDGLQPAMVKPFIHKGKWAIHELLPFLLSGTGAADVRVATFNISEDSLRPMFFQLEEKKIRSLRLLLDMNVRRHKLELLLFAANITPEVRLTANHSKILLIENELWKAGVVGSANLNNNPRYEAGFIFTDSQIYDYFRQEFDKIYQEDSIPFKL